MAGTSRIRQAGRDDWDGYDAVVTLRIVLHIMTNCVTSILVHRSLDSCRPLLAMIAKWNLAVPSKDVAVFVASIVECVFGASYENVLCTSPEE